MFVVFLSLPHRCHWYLLAFGRIPVSSELVFLVRFQLVAVAVADAAAAAAVAMPAVAAAAIAAVAVAAPMISKKLDLVFNKID